MLPVTSRRAWPAATAVAIAVALLTDLLRVFLPSSLIVFGEAGSTPATQLGGFAAVWFALGLAVLPVLVKVPPRWVAVGAAVVLLAARLVLQGSAGGGVQLYAAAVGVAAGVAWLVAFAAVPLPGRPIAAGVSTGIAASATLHVALRTVDLTWWAGAGPWLAVAVAGLALLGTTWVGGGVRASSGVDRELSSPALWFAIGPALAVAGIVTANPARAEAAAGWVQYRASFLILVACCLGVLGCLRARAWTRSPLVAAVIFGALLVGASLPHDRYGGIAGLLPSWAVWAQAGGAIGLGACLGWAGEGQRAGRPLARSGGAGGGLVAFFVVVFVYYAGYETPIGIPNLGALLAAGGLVAIAAVMGAGSAHTWTPHRVRPRRRRQEEFAVIAVTCVALVGALATAATGFGTIDRVTPQYPVRVVTYNVQMGFDPKGRFNPEDLAATVRAQRPQVVILNEVDRGWMVNGGHDVLQLMADDLGMPYVFAPAADEVWGDAVLTKFPILTTHSEKVSEPGAPTGGAALAITLKIDDTHQLGIVATHLQPNADGDVTLAQAQRVAALASGLIAKNRPVICAGDLNVQPGSPQFAAFGPRLVDALAKARPLPTFPSDRPVDQIDHVFTTPDLVASDIQVPASTDSDHRPVAVTLTPR
jgi:endonuclease/exonuclease/phosphatase family metal-dependent hydrolase